MLWGITALSPLFSRESVSGSLKDYREICLKASLDEEYFRNFRRIKGYSNIVEFSNKALGKLFYNHIKSSNCRLQNIDDFALLDEIGNPYRFTYEEKKCYSPTLLRYIAIADHIDKLFQLSDVKSIVEIGAGFGGQCYVLSKIHPFKNYSIYDLPEACALTNKVMNVLGLNVVQYIHDLSSKQHEAPIDLVISNYAFSECDIDLQMDYISKVIAKAQRGYIIYNQISSISGINSLSVQDFINILKGYGLNPQVREELILTYSSNVLITWNP